MPSCTPSTPILPPAWPAAVRVHAPSRVGGPALGPRASPASPRMKSGGTTEVPGRPGLDGWSDAAAIRPTGNRRRITSLLPKFYHKSEQRNVGWVTNCVVRAFAYRGSGPGRGPEKALRLDWRCGPAADPVDFRLCHSK